MPSWAPVQSHKPLRRASLASGREQSNTLGRQRIPIHDQRLSIRRLDKTESTLADRGQ